MEFLINQHSQLIMSFFMIKGRGMMFINHPLMYIRSHALVQCHRNSLKRRNRKLTLFKKTFKWAKPSLKAKKCRHIMIFINFIQKAFQLSNINKIKSFWLMSGPHGAGLVKNLCSTTNKCWPKMRINGRIKSELLLLVLMNQKNKFLSESIPKGGTKSST